MHTNLDLFAFLLHVCLRVIALLSNARTGVVLLADLHCFVMCVNSATNQFSCSVRGVGAGTGTRSGGRGGGIGAGFPSVTFGGPVTPDSYVQHTKR